MFSDINIAFASDTDTTETAKILVKVSRDRTQADIGFFTAHRTRCIIIIDVLVCNAQSEHPFLSLLFVCPILEADAIKHHRGVEHTSKNIETVYSS